MNKRMISATRASSKTVLLIHPDNDYSQALKQLLVLHQFRVIHERTASEGIYRVLKGEVDVTIMNAALPDVDGYHACRLIRMYNGWTPILLLTQHVTDADEIRGLDAGANDYIGKATGNAVLLARLRAMLRIHEEKGEIGDYRLSHSSMICKRPA